MGLIRESFECGELRSWLGRPDRKCSGGRM